MEQENYTLHIIFSINGWQQAKPLVSAHDKILLLQDGCYLAQQNLPQAHSLFARCLDVKARKIKADPHIEVIDDEQWVELTEHAHNTMSW